jgi:hypothetical protein
MPVTVESGQGPQIDVVILESRIDFSGQGASVIQRNGNQILFAFDNGLGEGSFRSEISGFTIRNDAVSVAHEEKSTIEVDPIESCNFCTGISLQKNHNVVVLNVEPALSLNVELSWPGILREGNLDFLVLSSEIVNQIFLILERVILRSKFVIVFVLI